MATSLAFDESNAVGKHGEQQVKDYLESKEWSTADTSKHPLFQELDIDLVIEKDDVLYTVDVKTDTYTTGNLFLEVVKNSNKESPGCLYTTRADFWFYLQGGKIHIFQPSEMIVFISNRDYRKVKHATKGYNGETLYYSEGVLVPIDEAPIKQTVNLEGEF